MWSELSQNDYLTPILVAQRIIHVREAPQQRTFYLWVKGVWRCHVDLILFDACVSVRFFDTYNDQADSLCLVYSSKLLCSSIFSSISLSILRSSIIPDHFLLPNANKHIWRQCTPKSGLISQRPQETSASSILLDPSFFFGSNATTTLWFSVCLASVPSGIEW